MTRRIEKIASRIQSPRISGVTLVITILSAAVFLIFPTQYVLRSAFVILSVFSLFTILIARKFLPEIKMSSLQESQFFDIENYHNQVYPVYLGHAKIEAYAEIPNWMTEFEIEMELDGPFKISEWTPSHISSSDNTLICKNDIDDFKFTIQIIGEEDELGDTTCNLIFNNNKTGNEIHAIKLNSKSELPTIDEDKLTEEEKNEWGITSPDQQPG